MCIRDRLSICVKEQRLLSWPNLPITSSMLAFRCLIDDFLSGHNPGQFLSNRGVSMRSAWNIHPIILKSVALIEHLYEASGEPLA